MNIKQRQFFPGQPEAVPPVYVESMTLQEVRCFGEKQTLKFTKPDGSIAQWTVILGENGVGKTTVLQCLAGMRPVEATNFAHDEDAEGNKPDAAAIIPQWASKNEEHRKYHRTIQDVYPKGFEGAVEAKEFLHIGLKLRSREMDSQIMEGRVWSVMQIATWHNTEGSISAERKIERMAGLHFYAYGASRRMAVQGRKEFKNDPGAESETLFSNESELHNAEEWLTGLRLTALFEKEILEIDAKNYHDEILSMLPRVLPMVDEVRFEMDTVPTKEVRVKFHTHYGWLPIESLSYGYQTMISWIVDFTRRMYDRYPESPDPLKEPAIVLVDEIDLHLHPRWQRQLTGFLSERFPKTQFIVTAHSPLIIQSEEVENVILLKRDPNKLDQVIVRQDEISEIRKWRLDQILTSELYGLVSAIAPSVEKLQQDRDDILGKDELSEADNQRLAEIAKELENLPTFSSPEAVAAEQLFKKTVDRLVEKDDRKIEAQAGC